MGMDRRVKVIQYSHRESTIDECISRMGSDESGTTGYEYMQ
jgi:hypothetical protein